MGLLSDITRENDIQTFVGKIERYIEANKDSPDVVRVLKNLGEEVLEMLPTFPEWAQKAHREFSKQ